MTRDPAIGMMVARDREGIMRGYDLRSRILLAIGASGMAAIACGSGARTQSPADASPGDGSMVSESGSSSGARDAAVGTDAASGDAPGDVLSSDAPADAATADGDACAQSGQPCAQTTDCCPGAICSGQHCYLSVRRPFLVGSSLRVAEAIARGDWLAEANDSAATVAALDPATAAALARDWLHDGCEEHASIAAFARFTMHLMSVGAPPEMIVASQQAALDEVNHARACFALARRYGGRALGPGALSLDGVMPPMTLVDIAALAAEEGCVGETLGVLLAEEQLAGTTDPLVRALLVSANVVDDERRHAELAWAFVKWAIVQGGEPVRRAVREAIQRAVRETLATPIRSYDGIDVAQWRAHGRVTCNVAHAVAERGVREIVEPCAAALLGDLVPRSKQPSGRSRAAGPEVPAAAFDAIELPSQPNGLPD
jgi:hypothetical protein